MRSQLRHHRVGGDGGVEPRGRAIGRAAHRRQSLLSRHQLGLARPQAGDRALLGGAARYVDVAILAPIHPKRHQTPLLLAGPHAQAVLPLLIDELEMRGAIASDEVGAAAALKMIRSVMIKGIEALTAECFLAAQRAGIARRGRGLAEEQLSDARLAEDGRIQPRAHGEPRHPPRRRDGAGRRHAARARHRAADDRGNRGAPARDGRARQGGAVRAAKTRRPRRDARCDQKASKP